MTLAIHVRARAVLDGIGAAFADPAPNCTAADLAQVTTGVSAATSVYLLKPAGRRNAFLTDIASLRATGRPRPSFPASRRANRSPTRTRRN